MKKLENFVKILEVSLELSLPSKMKILSKIV